MDIRLTGISALLLLTLPSMGQQQPSRGVNFYSFEKEAALGRALADDFRRRAPSVDDADLLAYVTRVAARLNEFAQSHFPLTIEISNATDSKRDTAGLPGGYVFVPLRLLASAEDEAEVARPVAHAIAHIATGQATRMATRGLIVNLATVPLIFMGGLAHDHAGALLIPVGLRKFQEEDEAQAERLGGEWMARSGLADSTFVTGEFAAMRERARAIARLKTGDPAPPSLRKRRP